MITEPRPKRYLAAHALLGSELQLARNVLLEVGPDGYLVTVQADQHSEDAIPLDGVLCPGLIDCHVHLTLSGGQDVEADALALTPETAVTAASTAAQAHLRNGVTTLRDLGSPWDTALRLAKLDIPGPLPHIVAAGAITNTNGHGSLFARIADGGDEVATQISAIAASGAPWVKLFVTGGILAAQGNPGHRQLNDEEVDVAVKMAKESGLRVAAHAHGPNGILAAIAAGVDSVEHLSYADADVMEALSSSMTTPVSTYVATQRLCEGLDTASPDTEAFFHHLTAERNTLITLSQSDLQFAIGTDAGTPFNPHGDGLLAQALLMQAEGVHPRRILQALTVQGSQLLGQSSGELSVGYRADWIMLDQNPIEDIAALGGIREVYLSGTRVSLVH